MSLLEAFGESLPQMIIQLYDFLKTLQKTTCQTTKPQYENKQCKIGISTLINMDYNQFIQIISMIFSLAFISHTITMFYENRKKMYYFRNNIRKADQIAYTIWVSIFLIASKFLLISSRVIFMVLLATVRWSSILILGFCHLFWYFLITREENPTLDLFADDSLREKEIKMLGFIFFEVCYPIANFFLFFRLDLDSSTRTRFFVYYIIILVENSAIILLFYLEYNESLGFFFYFIIYAFFGSNIGVFIQLRFFEYTMRGVME